MILKELFYPLGTFGQEQAWKLGDPSTYKHPLIPEDILLDKSSLTVMFEHSTIGPPIAAESSTDINRESSESLKELGVDDVEETREVVEPKEALELGIVVCGFVDNQ